MSRLRVVLTGFFLLLLCACSSSSGSGSGSSSSSGNSDSVQHGQFVDSAVSGVRFSTETRSGVTDSEGRFEYLEGETVSFYLGDLLLGHATGAVMVSPFDLVEGVTPVVGGALKKAIHENPRGPSFSTVINLITLLQTLDSDEDPENGIEIASDVASLFMPNSIDFNQHWREFNYDEGFRQAMAEAKAGSLLDSARQARRPWRAIAHLYASLGVESELRVERVVSGDTDVDGTADYIYRYEFDAKGELTREVIEHSDGRPDRIRAYTYDTDGNNIRYEEDDNNDGIPDDITHYAYDADGNRNVYARDRNGDGMLEYTETYAYDINGNRTRREKDTDGDGSPNSITDYKYDAEGNLTRSENDSDGDGTPESIGSYSTYVDGNTERVERDNDSDGIADSIRTTTYDAYGNRLRTEYDDDADGALDTILTDSYDESGNTTRSEYDWDGDGVPNSIHISTYDANGNEALYTYDSNGSGTPEQIHTLYYEDDSYEIRREQDINANGSPDRIITKTYDSDSDGWWWTFNRGRTSVVFVLTLPSFNPNNSYESSSSFGSTRTSFSTRVIDTAE